MGTHLFSILASDDGVFKAIGTIVVLIIWGIGAITSATKKAQEAARRKQLQAGAALPPSLPPVVAKVSTPTPAPRRAPMGPLPTRKVVPPVPPRISARPASLPPPLEKIAPSALAAVAPKASLASSGLSKALVSRAPRTPIVAGRLTAKTVRSNFILAEILQPPLALREQRNL